MGRCDKGRSERMLSVYFPDSPHFFYQAALDRDRAELSGVATRSDSSCLLRSCSQGPRRSQEKCTIEHVVPEGYGSILMSSPASPPREGGVISARERDQGTERLRGYCPCSAICGFRHSCHLGTRALKRFAITAIAYQSATVCK